MKKKWRNIPRWNKFLFIACCALWSYTDAVYESQKQSAGIWGLGKYLLLAAGMIVCYSQVWMTYRSQKEKGEESILIYWQEMKFMLGVAALFLFLSALQISMTGKASTESIKEIGKLVIPILYAVGILNTFEEEDIYRSMIWILLFCIVGYFLEIGVEQFTVENFRSISFADSYSPFESSYSAGTSIVLCCFFMYYRKKKRYLLAALLFAIATFKRAAVLFAFCLLVYPVFASKEKRIGRAGAVLLAIFFLGLTLFYQWSMTSPGGEALFHTLFGKDVAEVTVGRSPRLTQLMEESFQSYGYGSTTAALGCNMEMDLVKINVEMGLVGLTAFVTAMVRLGGRNLYCMLIMADTLFNMLTSHSINNTFEWMLRYIMLGCILYKTQPSEREKEEKADDCISDCTGL